MTYFKYLQFPRPQSNTAGDTKSSHERDCSSADDQSKDADGIRYANTVQGRLCQRDTEALRRFVLDAPTFEERERRKAELFVTASSTMSVAPSMDTVPSVSLSQGGFQGTHGGVVNVGLFFLPVVFTTERVMNVYTRIPLDRALCSDFTRRLQEVILRAFPSQLNSIRIESLVALIDVIGSSPLAVHSAVTNEANRNAGRFKPVAPKIPSSISQPSQDRWRMHQSTWSLKLEQYEDFVVAVGPRHPGAFMLVIYATWDLRSPQPDFSQLGAGARAQLQALLQHYLAQDSVSQKKESGQMGPNERIQLRVGTIEPMNSALTKCQGMQIQMASDRAYEVGLGFTTSHAMAAFDIQGCKSTMLGQDADGDPLEIAVINYTYDGFWRPDTHMAGVQSCLPPLPPQSNPIAKPDGSSQSGQAELPFAVGEEEHCDGDGPGAMPGTTSPTTSTTRH